MSSKYDKKYVKLFVLDVNNSVNILYTNNRLFDIHENWFFKENTPQQGHKYLLPCFQASKTYALTKTMRFVFQTLELDFSILCQQCLW
jgi:hypothetical protein